MNTKTLLYILKRILLALLTVWVVITVTFFVMRAVPGGPFLSEKAVSEAAQKALEVKYGLDKPLMEQYITYLKDIVTKFDFGPSIKLRGRMVIDVIADGMKTSIKLGLIAAFAALGCGIVLGCVAAILLVISFVLINNTVSLSIYSRRFVLRTMKLVGATPSFIRRPFVRTGISNGAIAGLLASAVLAAIQAYAMEADAEIAELLSWTASGCVYAALVVLGAIICAGASWFAATRYLRLNYDSLYRR